MTSVSDDMGICLMCRAAFTGTGVSVPCDLMPPKKKASLAAQRKAAKKSPSTSPDDKNQSGAKSGSDQEDLASPRCRLLLRLLRAGNTKIQVMSTTFWLLNNE